MKERVYNEMLKNQRFPFLRKGTACQKLKTSNRRNRTRFSKAWELRLDSDKLSGFFYVQKQLNIRGYWLVNRAPEKDLYNKDFLGRRKRKPKENADIFYVGVVKRLCFDAIARNVFVLPNTRFFKSPR